MQRPVSITIFGILNIAFAVMGIAGLIFSTIIMSSQKLMAANPVMAAMNHNPAYAAWMKLSVPLGIVSTMLLLAAGIGLLLLKNWARILSIVYGIFAIVIGLVGAVVMLSTLLQILNQQQGQQSMVPLIGIGGGAVGSLIGLIYPALLIFFMFRPNVVATCHPAPSI